MEDFQAQREISVRAKPASGKSAKDMPAVRHFTMNNRASQFPAAVKYSREMPDSRRTEYRCAINGWNHVEIVSLDRGQPSIPCGIPVRGFHGTRTAESRVADSAGERNENSSKTKGTKDKRDPLPSTTSVARYHCVTRKFSNRTEFPREFPPRHSSFLSVFRFFSVFRDYPRLT